MTECGFSGVCCGGKHIETSVSNIEPSAPSVFMNEPEKEGKSSADVSEHTIVAASPARRRASEMGSFMHDTGRVTHSSGLQLFESQRRRSDGLRGYDRMLRGTIPHGIPRNQHTPQHATAPFGVHSVQDDASLANAVLKLSSHDAGAHSSAARNAASLQPSTPMVPSYTTVRSVSVSTMSPVTYASQRGFSRAPSGVPWSSNNPALMAIDGGHGSSGSPAGAYRSSTAVMHSGDQAVGAPLFRLLNTARVGGDERADEKQYTRQVLRDPAPGHVAAVARRPEGELSHR